MPSMLVGNQSGGDLVISGNPWSGFYAPLGYVRLRWDFLASGACYIGFSGGLTANSGQVLGSGGISSGMLDGMQLPPGQYYDVPKSVFANHSGSFQLFATCDSACSGKRLYIEVF